MSDLAPHLPAFAAAYAIQLVSVSSPGPAVAMLLGVGATQGRRAALATTLGISVGAVAACAGTLAGLGLVLSQAAWAMSVMKMVGAAYLAWLAWGAFRRAVAPPSVAAAEVAPAPWPRHLAAGLLLALTNPKAILFWLAIASVGPTEGGGPLVAAAFLAGVFAISLGGHGAWALALSSNPVRAAHARARRWVEGLLGAFFASAALGLAASRG